VHANGKTVTIDQDVTVKSLRLAIGGTAAAGGVFVTNGSTPDATTITVLDGILAAHHQSGNGSGSARTAIIDVRADTPNIEIDTNGQGVAGGGGSYRHGIAVLSAANGAAAPGSVGSVTVKGDVTGGIGNSAYGLYVAGGTVGITGDITGSSAYGVSVAGGTVDITGDITGGGSYAYGLYVAGGTVGITGDITGGIGSSAYGVSVAGGTVDITGDITGGGGSYAYGVSVAGGTVDITGDITGSSTYGVYVTSTATPLVITGNLFASIAPAVYLDSAHQTHVTINGNITAGTNPGHTFALRINHTNKQVRVNGTITGTQHAQAISSVQTIAPLAISGILSVPLTGHWPLDVPTWIIWDAENFEFHTYTDLNWPQDTGNPVAVTRYPAGTPDEADVRQGVQFGQGLIFEGTLKVPPAAAVAVGVPVDATVGAGVVKLADVAAVTGAQIAAATNADT